MLALATYISSGVLLRSPTAKACCLPSTTTVTIVPGSKFGVIIAPLEVKPGAIMLAPASTACIAPASTCINGQIKGSDQSKVKHN